MQRNWARIRKPEIMVVVNDKQITRPDVCVIPGNKVLVVRNRSSIQILENLSSAKFEASLISGPSRE